MAQLPESTEIAFEQIDDISPCEDWLLPFVCAYDGKKLGLLSGDKKVSAYGFLKNESEKAFSLIGLDLTRRTFDKDRFGFESVDLEEYSKDVATAKGLLFIGEETAERWVQLLVLARAAYQRGALDTCERFLAAAAVQKTSASFGADCRAALARAGFSEILLSLGDLSLTRPQILAKVRTFLDAFPETQFSQTAATLEDDLIKMVAQDAKHQSPENITRLAEDQQIDEWLFQLRNQNAIQTIGPTEWDIFWKDKEITHADIVQVAISIRTASPAMELVKIGNAAVPKLIERIGDSMPTRSSPYRRTFIFNEKPLTVGDCAEMILSRIAGQRFGDGQSSDLARQQAEAWWNEISNKGEEQYLVERVSYGGQMAVDSSSALATKFPDVAFDCIAKAIAQSKDTGSQSKLLNVIGQLPATGKTDEYLRHQLKNARELETRLVAARLIMRNDRNTAINAMIQEFHEMITNDAGGHWDSEELALIAFLSSSDSVPAIQKLRESYDSRRPSMRTAIILSLLHGPSKSGLDQPISTEIEAILVHGLSDTFQRVGYSYASDDGVFKNPRNCELAGYVLRTIMPDEYKFEFPLPADKLEIQRSGAINQWRAKNQLPKLPIENKS